MGFGTFHPPVRDSGTSTFGYVAGVSEIRGRGISSRATSLAAVLLSVHLLSSLCL